MAKEARRSIGRHGEFEFRRKARVVGPKIATHRIDDGQLRRQAHRGDAHEGSVGIRRLGRARIELVVERAAL